MTRELLFTLTRKDFEIQTSEGEEWRQVTGFPDYYVSSFGRVLSTKFNRLKLLKPQPDNDGYLHVGLVRKGDRNKVHTIKVSALVSREFMGVRPGGLVCCHNDGNPENNRLDNFRYDTQKSNINDIKKHGTGNPPVGCKNGMSKLTNSQVIEMRTLFKNGEHTSQLSSLFGISIRQTRDIVNNKAWRISK